MYRRCRHRRPQPAAVTDPKANRSADPKDHEPQTPAWAPRSEREIADYWLAKMRDQLTGQRETAKQ
jgi:hypothetical protein